MPNVKRGRRAARRDLPEVRLAARHPLRPLRRLRRLQHLPRCEPPCDYTRDLDGPEAGRERRPPAEDAEIPPCEKCGRPMALKRSRFGTFLGCTGYPECKNIRKIGPKPSRPSPPASPAPSARQGRRSQEKNSRRGKIFYSCSRYPGLQVRALEQADRRDLPQVRQPPADRKDHQEEGHRLALPAGRLRLRDPRPSPRPSPHRLTPSSGDTYPGHLPGTLTRDSYPGQLPGTPTSRSRGWGSRSASGRDGGRGRRGRRRAASGSARRA